MTTPKKTLDLAMLLVSIIGTAAALVEFFTKTLPENTYMIIIGVLVVAWLYMLIDKFFTKEHIEQIENQFQKVNKSLIFVIPMLIVLLIGAKFLFSQEEDCEKYRDQIVIGVAKFTEELADPSTELFQNIKERTHGHEDIYVKALSSYIDMRSDEGERLKKLTSETECLEQGIIAYGYWINTSNEPLFNCHLFIKESDDNKTNYPKHVLDSLDYKIQLPEEISIQASREILKSWSETIAGIALLYNGSLVDARRLFEDQLLALHQPGQNDLQRRFPSLHAQGSELSKPEYHYVIKSVINFKRNETKRDLHLKVKGVIQFYLATIELILGNKDQARKWYAHASTDQEEDTHNIRDMAQNNLEYLNQTSPIPQKDSVVQVPSLKKTKVSKPKAKNTWEKIQESSSVEEPWGDSEDEWTEEEPMNQEEIVEKEPETPKNIWIRELPIETSGHYIVRTEDYTRYAIADADYNLISAIYDEVRPFKDSNYAKIIKDKKYGFIDDRGVVIAKPQYQDARDFSNRIAAVKLNGLWGFINANNTMTIPPQYDRVIQSFIRETAVVILKNKSIRIDKRGNKVRNEKLK